MRRTLAIVVFMAVAAFPALLLAHEGHAHHVMGTVNSIDSSKVEVKDESGKLVPCQLTADTKYMRGETLVTVPGIKVGERIMVEVAEKDGKRIAHVVRLGQEGGHGPSK